MITQMAVVKAIEAPIEEFIMIMAGPTRLHCARTRAWEENRHIVRNELDEHKTFSQTQ
jgi:hypothetical protein